MPGRLRRRSVSPERTDDDAATARRLYRELVYERSQEQVKADIDRLNPNLRNSSRR